MIAKGSIQIAIGKKRPSKTVSATTRILKMTISTHVVTILALFGIPALIAVVFIALKRELKRHLAEYRKGVKEKREADRIFQRRILAHKIFQEVQNG
jgi:hypothetical protein